MRTHYLLLACGTASLLLAGCDGGALGSDVTRVCGTVTDQTSGAAIEGVGVALAFRNGMGPSSAVGYSRSEPNGAYCVESEFDHAEPIFLEVNTEPIVWSGEEPQWNDRYASYTGPPISRGKTAKQHVRLARHERNWPVRTRACGRVREAGTGAPIEGISAAIVSDTGGEEDFSYNQTFTGSDGRFCVETDRARPAGWPLRLGVNANLTGTAYDERWRTAFAPLAAGDTTGGVEVQLEAYAR